MTPPHITRITDCDVYRDYGLRRRLRIVRGLLRRNGLRDYGLKTSLPRCASAQLMVFHTKHDKRCNAKQNINSHTNIIKDSSANKNIQVIRTTYKTYENVYLLKNKSYVFMFLIILFRDVLVI